MTDLHFIQISISRLDDPEILLNQMTNSSQTRVTVACTELSSISLYILVSSWTYSEKDKGTRLLGYFDPNSNSMFKTSFFPKTALRHNNVL